MNKYVRRVRPSDEVENYLRADSEVPEDSPLTRYDTAIEEGIAITDDRPAEIVIENDEKTPEKHLENTPRRAILANIQQTHKGVENAKSNSKEFEKH
jgi:hypothetical protein